MTHDTEYLKARIEEALAVVRDGEAVMVQMANGTAFLLPADEAEALESAPIPAGTRIHVFDVVGNQVTLHPDHVVSIQPVNLSAAAALGLTLQVLEWQRRVPDPMYEWLDQTYNGA